MKVSVNLIKQWLDFDLLETAGGIDGLAERIGAQLGGVEEVIDLGVRYKNVVIVRVVVCEKLENSDHLNRCLVDDGGVVKGVERNENGLVQVITGAPNVHAGMLAVWLPPGTTVPESFDKDPFVLESRPMRGALSHGMLASQRELALGDEHDGILEINPEEDVPGNLKPEPGAGFAAVYGLDDYVIDIENKMFTHRPDLFGQLGVAREISAIMQGVTQPEEGFVDTRYENPEWYWQVPEFHDGSGVGVSVFNDAPDVVRRFMAVAMNGVTIKPSPLWLQCALVAMGSKPINNVVDLTNYIMLVTAQPTHAYDYDKLRGHKLGARMAKKGESVTLLNGKTYQLDHSDIVIADGEGIVGLGGVMGGLESEVTNDTKNIVLEVANFDMYTIRRTSMRYGIFTDAVTRFNKGQSPLQNDRVMSRLMQLIEEVIGARQASKVFDIPSSRELDKTTLSGEVAASTKFINDRLGVDLTTDQIGNLLRRVNIASRPIDEKKLDEPAYVAPYWRTDIGLPEDIVEEVSRLYGYDKLPKVLPRRSIAPAHKNNLLELKKHIREVLSKAGANEVLTYSFVHGHLFKKVGQDQSLAFKLGNALSPDLQYYRLSLMPSLLDKVHMNIKASYDEFALFELGKAHVFNEPDPTEKTVPKEVNALSFVYAAKKLGQGSAYYAARKYLVDILSQFGVMRAVKFEKLAGADLYDNPWIIQMAAPFDPERSAVLRDSDGLIWGVIGEFKGAVRRGLKLPEHSAGFEIDPLLLIQKRLSSTYAPLPRFPKVTQDMTLKVPAQLPYQELFDFVWNELGKVQPENTFPSLGPRSIYQNETDTAHKQVTLRLQIASYERTLTDQEVNTMLDAAALAARDKFGAERV